MKNKKELAITKSDIQSLSPEIMNTLLEDGDEDALGSSNSIKFPRELKILRGNTDKKSVFANLGELSFEDEGKIFVSPERVKNSEGRYEVKDKLHAEDLYETFTGILMGIESGVEITHKGKDDAYSSVVARSKDMITQEEREAWLDEYNPARTKHGYDYQNMMKFTLSRYDYEGTVKAMEEGENPFVVLTLHGKFGWNIVKSIRDQRTQITRDLGLVGTTKKPIYSLFKFNITTEIVTTDAGNEQHIFKVALTVNDPKDAVKFVELLELFKTQFTYFNNIEGKHDPELRVIHTQAEENPNAHEFDDMAKDSVDGEVVEEEEKKEEKADSGLEDLPF